MYNINDTIYSLSLNSSFQGLVNPLVVFCCSENENSSFLASALDCFRLRMPPSSRKEDIHGYLRKQFMMPQRKQHEEFKYAGEVDSEGLVDFFLVINSMIYVI